MKIPQEKFEEIAQANDIIDIISGYLQVKNRGKSFLAVCPFHPDKNPSLHISQEKQVYHCFSCKASGNVYTFVQNYEKITFIEAVEKLAQRAGITLKYHSREPDLSNEISKLFEINKSASKYFYRNLQNLSGSEKDFVYGYLDTRKIDKKLIDKFGIGYSNKNWDSLFHHFSEEDIFKKGEIEKAGLLIQSEKDKDNFYDRFRGRLMFPIFNENDKVVGFGGRKLYDDDPGGKYINSPETKIYNKSKVLYGLNFAKEKIRYYDYVILVEGYMDLISLSRFDVDNVVASSGTALTEEQVKLISRYTKNIYVLFDSDFAGINAAKRGIEIILEAGLDINVITLPEDEDPDSFINKNGKEEFLKQLNKKKSVINFISELYEKEGKLKTVNDKTSFIKEIVGYIGKIPDKIKRAFYFKEIAGVYSLYESDLRDELEKVLKENKSKTFPKTSVVIPDRKTVNNSKTDHYFKLEKEAVEFFIKGDNDCLLYLYENFDVNWVRDLSIRDIINEFLDQLNYDYHIDIPKAISNLKNEKSIEYISEIVNEKHEISTFETNYDNTILASNPGNPFDSNKARLLINKFIIINLENERKNLQRADPSNFRVVEIGIMINQLSKEN